MEGSGGPKEVPEGPTESQKRTLKQPFFLGTQGARSVPEKNGYPLAPKGPMADQQGAKGAHGGPKGAPGGVQAQRGPGRYQTAQIGSAFLVSGQDTKKALANGGPKGAEGKPKGARRGSQASAWADISRTSAPSVQEVRAHTPKVGPQRFPR